MTLSRRWRGLAALLLFVAVPLGLLGLATVNWLTITETDAASARQEDLIAQLDARLARLQTDSGTPLDTSTIYLRDTASALAAADLQQRLAGVVGDAGGRIIETQAVDQVEGAPADEVSVRVAFDADNAGVMQIIHAVETGLPLMFVDAFTLREVPGASGTDDPANPLLRAELTVRAAWRAP